MDNGRKKIALLTFWKNANHGTALQAFALCKYILRLGFNAEYILYNSRVGISKKTSLIRKFIEVFNLFKFYGIKGVVEEDKRKIPSNENHLILQFWNKIPHSNVVYNKQSCRESLDLYSLFIVGGDQLWNPYITISNYFYLLDFVDVPSKKHSYCPSFGVSSLSESYLKKLKRHLTSFSNIGCRDTIISTFLSDFLKKKVTNNVDPVLLLSKNEWQDVMEPLPLPPKFILCYQLGDLHKVRISAKELAEQKRIPVLFLTHDSAPVSISNISPNNFIYIIANADIVVTDSYHGILFSIIFEKKFVPFYKRFGDESILDNFRIYDLCHSLDIPIECLANISLDHDSMLYDKIIKSKKYIQNILNYA